MDLTTTAGFEIEFSGSSLDRVERELRDRDINCHNHRTWRHSPGNIWDLKTDSSCGWEAVSPVLHTYEELIDAAGVGSLISHAGGAVTDRCGFHVHIGTMNLSHEQLENVFRFMTRYEWAFFLMVPPSRRTSTYCKRLSIQTIQSIKRASFGRNDWWLHTWNDKNVWLNGRRYPDIKTVEFRLMPGTLNKNFIIGYVTFLQSVFSSVKDRTINWGVASSKDDRSLFQTMLGQAGFYGPWITPEAKQLSMTGRKWAIERYKLANGQMQGLYHSTLQTPEIPTVDITPSWDRTTPTRPRRPRRTTPAQEAIRQAAEMVHETQQAPYVQITPTPTTVITTPVINNPTSTAGDWIVSWGNTSNVTNTTPVFTTQSQIQSQIVSNAIQGQQPPIQITSMLQGSVIANDPIDPIDIEEEVQQPPIPPPPSPPIQG